ncbi:hypothetical protein [Leptolyngbya ectocarpi]|nr:hypothetical protein [Leptolyngbya ectocarpi]
MATQSLLVLTDYPNNLSSLLKAKQGQPSAALGAPSFMPVPT